MAILIPLTRKPVAPLLQKKAVTSATQVAEGVKANEKAIVDAEVAANRAKASAKTTIKQRANANYDALRAIEKRPDVQAIRAYMAKINEQYMPQIFPLQTPGARGVSGDRVLSLAAEGFVTHQLWSLGDVDAHTKYVPMKSFFLRQVPDDLAYVDFARLEQRLAQAVKLISSPNAAKLPPVEFGQTPMDFYRRGANAELEAQKSLGELEREGGGD